MKAKKLIHNNGHYFFGYYDKFQDNASGDLLLVLETDFMDRMPTAKDAAGICIVEQRSGKVERIAETHSWCWQQGCMLQWLPSAAEDTIIYNTIVDGQFGCCIMNINTGKKRFFNRPVYTVSPNGKFALSLNFSRLAELRPGYGYEGIPDPWRKNCSSEDDGIYYLDFETGQSRLIISLAQLVGNGTSVNYKNSPHWFNHLLISPDNKRFAFLHRWLVPQKPGARMHQFYTANVDGSDIFLLNDNLTSHFNWKNASTLIAWADIGDGNAHYYLFKDKSRDMTIVGREQLTVDGHMSYNQVNQNWFVTDTYPYKDNKRRLLVFNERENRCLELGRFFANPELNTPCRCDLHPRWSRDGKRIYFDSIHEGNRGIYIAELSDTNKNWENI